MFSYIQIEQNLPLINRLHLYWPYPLVKNNTKLYINPGIKGVGETVWSFIRSAFVNWHVWMQILVVNNRDVSICNTNKVVFSFQLSTVSPRAKWFCLSKASLLSYSSLLSYGVHLITNYLMTCKTNLNQNSIAKSSANLPKWKWHNVRIGKLVNFVETVKYSVSFYLQSTKITSVKFAWLDELCWHGKRSFPFHLLAQKKC